MADEGTTGNTEAKVEVKEGAKPYKAKEVASVPVSDETLEAANNPDAVKNALQSERRAAKEAGKRAEAAEARVREFEDANASEVEKLTKRADRAEQQSKEANAKLLRFEVAAEKKVPSELTPLLTGSTKEELESQATLLLDATAKKADFDGGARETSGPARTDEQQFNDHALIALGLAPEQQK